MNIIGGSIITEKDESYYNTCLVYNRKGELVSSYSKMHLYSYYGYEEDKYVNCGENPVIVELDGVKFGLSICYDIRFPELYRAYAKAGADVFVNCAAWGSNKPIPWEVMTKSRAVENQTYMLALTQCGKIKNDEYNLGISRIIDYKGEEISIIKLREGIIYAELNLNKMYEFRAKSPTIKDIKENNYVLTPGRYVGTEEQEDDGIPFEEKMKTITTELKAQFEESHKLEEEIKKNLEAIGYGI